MPSFGTLKLSSVSHFDSKFCLQATSWQSFKWKSQPCLPNLSADSFHVSVSFHNLFRPLPQLLSSDQVPIKNSCEDSLSSHAYGFSSGPAFSDLSDILDLGSTSAPLFHPSVESLGLGWGVLGWQVELVWPDVFPSCRNISLVGPSNTKTFKELCSTWGEW